MNDNHERMTYINPTIRAGIYKSLDQIPDHHRLRVYAQEFSERDIWGEYMTIYGSPERETTKKNHQYLEKVEARWKAFMESRGRHHALCTPADANGYATHLREECCVSPVTATNYWIYIERFYRWLFHHTEYPHRYHPFVMAAANLSLIHI